MRNSLMTVGVIVTALSVAPACATKKFVRTSVGEVNDKVTSQGKSLEETQERVRVAEGRITETDAKATAAGDSASKANAAAADAVEQGDGSRTHRGNARGRHRSRNPQADLRDRAQRRSRPVQARQGRAA